MDDFALTCNRSHVLNREASVSMAPGSDSDGKQQAQGLVSGAGQNCEIGCSSLGL